MRALTANKLQNAVFSRSLLMHITRSNSTNQCSKHVLCSYISQKNTCNATAPA